MGSIPTRSRHLLPGLGVLALLLTAPEARAQDTAVVAPDSAAQGPRQEIVYPRPPVSPMGAFFRSLILPGWSQSILDRRLTGGLFMAVEGLALGMVVKSSSELSYLKSTGDPRAEDKKQEQEDWLAVLAFNHLFAALEGYVAAHLWDFPADVRIRATPAGPGGLRATVTVPLGRR